MRGWKRGCGKGEVALIAAGRWVRAAAAGWLLLCLRAFPSGRTRPDRAPRPPDIHRRASINRSPTGCRALQRMARLPLRRAAPPGSRGSAFPTTAHFASRQWHGWPRSSGSRCQSWDRIARDRWGRRLVRVQREGPTGSVDLGRGLVEAGLAIVDPQRVDRSCADDFLASEAGARQRSLGVWADAGYKPIGTDQADRLKDRIGTFAIVEGRVRNVGERAQWTYLNFGGRWAEDFTVIIPKRIWKRMTDRGGDAAAFRGRPVRVRGILEAWQGASVTVEIPEMIEFLPR